MCIRDRDIACPTSVGQSLDEEGGYIPMKKAKIVAALTALVSLILSSGSLYTLSLIHSDAQRYSQSR